MMTAWPELVKEEFIQLLHGPGHNNGTITVNWKELESYYDLPYILSFREELAPQNKRKGTVEEKS